jgi:hypothetical protein
LTPRENSFSIIQSRKLAFEHSQLAPDFPDILSVFSSLDSNKTFDIAPFVQFTRAVFAIVFERNARPIVSNILRSMWASHPVDLSLVRDRPQLSADLIIDLIQILVFVFARRRAHVAHFTRHASLVARCLARTEPSRAFLHDVFQCWAFLPTCQTASDCSAFLTVIQKIDGTGPSELVTSMNDEKEIQRPQIGEVMIRAFLDSNELISVFQLLMDLSDSSLSNAMAGHEANF